MHKIEERKDLCKDPHSKAIINTDINAYQHAVNSAKERKAYKKRSQELEQQIDSLKLDVELIKDMLQKIVEKM